MARVNQIACLLAVLVTLSGCSGLIPGDGQAQDSPTPFGPRSYDAAVDGHAGALRESGQFKLQRVRRVTYPDRAVNGTPFSNEMVADFESDQYLIGQALEGHNGVYRDGAAYQAGTTTWQRRQLDNDSTVYRRLPPDSAFSVRMFIIRELWAMENFSKEFPFERNGTAIFQGQPVTRYTAGALGSAESCLHPTPYVIENVRSVNVVALVDERGIIRQFECALSGETITGERFEERLLWRVTGIGTVEIREPHPLVNETRGG